MAERLLVAFETQGAHRMALEKHILHWDVRRANAGLVAGYTFGVAVLGASILFVMNGHEGPGVLGVVADFLTFGGAFLYGNITRRNERNQKAGGR
jgi:hypothetical protein